MDVPKDGSNPLLCALRVLLFKLEDHTGPMIPAIERGAVNVPGHIEHNPSERLGAILAAPKGMENLRRPFPRCSKTQHVHRPSVVGAALVGCSIDISSLVQYGRAIRKITSGEGVEHNRIPTAVAIRRELEDCCLRGAEAVSRSIHRQGRGCSCSNYRLAVTNFNK